MQGAKKPVKEDEKEEKEEVKKEEVKKAKEVSK